MASLASTRRLLELSGHRQNESERKLDKALGALAPLARELAKIELQRAQEQLLHQANCPTHLYRFEWPSPLYGARLGAAHAMEIPFVLGNTPSSRAQEFIGAVAPAALAHDMHTRWARFVRGDDMPDWADADERFRVFKMG